MEEEIEPTEEYVAAFNLGYKLNRASPEIAELIDHIAAKNNKMNALKAGIAQSKDEAFDQLTPDWLRDSNTKGDKGENYDAYKDLEPDKE